jgi:hypothetical protein
MQLGSSCAAAFESDVLKAVRAILQRTHTQLPVDAQALRIDSVRVAEDRRSRRSGFRVAGR